MGGIFGLVFFSLVGCYVSVFFCVLFVCVFVFPHKWCKI